MPRGGLIDPAMQPLTRSVSWSGMHGRRDPSALGLATTDEQTAAAEEENDEDDDQDCGHDRGTSKARASSSLQHHQSVTERSVSQGARMRRRERSWRGDSAAEPVDVAEQRRHPMCIVRMWFVARATAIPTAVIWSGLVLISRSTGKATVLPR